MGELNGPSGILWGAVWVLRGPSGGPVVTHSRGDSLGALWRCGTLCGAVGALGVLWEPGVLWGICAPPPAVVPQPAQPPWTRLPAQQRPSSPGQPPLPFPGKPCMAGVLVATATPMGAGHFMASPEGQQQGHRCGPGADTPIAQASTRLCHHELQDQQAGR